MTDIYLVEDGERHWYAAESEADALKLHDDAGLNEDEKGEDEFSVTRLDADQVLTVHGDAGADLPKTQTCREWCAEVGRGFVASTVF